MNSSSGYTEIGLMTFMHINIDIYNNKAECSKILSRCQKND